MLPRTASDAGSAGRVKLRRDGAQLQRTPISSSLSTSARNSMVGSSSSNLIARSTSNASSSSLRNAKRSLLSSSSPQLTSPALTGATGLSATSSGRRLLLGGGSSIRRRCSNRYVARGHTTTSPIMPHRCRSPSSASVMETSWSPTPPRLLTAPTSRGAVLLRTGHKVYSGNDQRRWSFASLPSTSGCGTTPCSSTFSSQFSSSERLDESMALGGFASSHEDSCHSLEISCHNAHLMGSSTDHPSLLLRPRSRSLNSSPVSNHSDADVGLRVNLYKERFPKAKADMESRLTAFLEQIADNEHEDALLSDGAAHFIRLQLTEIASNCLAKSKSDQVSSSYFCDLSEQLDQLMVQAAEKCLQSSYDLLQTMVRRLLIIISRPARLLECLEFNPDYFIQVLEEVEDVARDVVSEPIPQYIIKKLGLTSLSPESRAEAEAVPDPPTQEICKDSSRSRLAPSEDDFESVKLISNGAYGAVYLARHRETRQRFALKKMNKSTTVLRNQVDQVFAERDILTFSDNPFVVSFYGSFETKRHLCLVLEYVEGGDCATLLKQITVFPVDMARLYLAETVLAVEYLHSYGIVHRDLKPDNLLITAVGHIKLTDFGLSRIGLMNRCEDSWEEVRQFRDQQICGTPDYIAPEVILRQGYGKPVDWWSLGIILYEFLVGIAPFAGETPDELFANVIEGELEWPEEPYTPPFEAQALILSLLQKNPHSRLGSHIGASEIKNHPFFLTIDFESLLREKAEFIPNLENEEDTSYFDSRIDRYQHADDSGDEPPDPSPSVFSSFTSSSPRFSFLAEMASAGRSDSESSSQSSPGVKAQALLPPKHKISGGGAPRVIRSTPLSGGHVSQLAAEPSQLYDTSATDDTITVSSPTTVHESEHVTVRKPTPTQRQTHTGVGHKEHKDRKGGTHVLVRQKPAVPPRQLSGSREDIARKLAPTAEEDSLMKTVVESVLSRRRRTYTAPLPKLSISQFGSGDVEGPGEEATTNKDEGALALVERSCSTDGAPVPVGSSLSAGEGTGSVLRKKGTTLHQDSALTATPVLSKQLKLRSVSAQGLHLVIPPLGGELQLGKEPLLGSARVVAPKSPDGSSTSSRDNSPTRGFRPVPSFLKPPVVIRRGPSGFGFFFRTTRVYIGSTEYYTLQHLVTQVEENGPAFEAGLRANDLLTHVNSEPISNQLHTTVVHLMLTSGSILNLRVTPLDQTTIKVGPARRGIGQRARRKAPRRKAKHQRRSSRSLFRRLSGKKAAAEMKTLSRSVSSSEGLLAIAPGLECSSSGVSSTSASSSTGPMGASLSGSRPSSLHGLGHKLAMALKSPRIRKQSTTMPLSPLARSEQQQRSRSPSPVAAYAGTGSSRKTITKPRKSDAGCEQLDGSKLSVAGAQPTRSDSCEQLDGSKLSVAGAQPTRSDSEQQSDSHGTNI